MDLSVTTNTVADKNGYDEFDYEMGAVIHGEGVVTNLTYHKDGRWLLMSTNESSLHLIDSLSGEEKKKLYAKTHGVGKVAYSHHEECVLISGERKAPGDIRFLCLYDNRYIRNFRGHSERLNSLSMSPVDDCFLTASNDKIVQLWNLSSPSPIGKILLPGSCDLPIAKFDDSGMVFGVLCRDNMYRRHTLKLFDARNSTAGPFQDIFPDHKLIESAAIKAAKIAANLTAGGGENSNSRLADDFNGSSSNGAIQQMVKKTLQTQWTSFEFSSDGNHLLLNSQADQMLVLDGFRAEVEPLLVSNRKNDAGIALGASFSTNSKYILTGNDDNDFLVLDKATGELKKTLSGHVAPINCICSNPKFDVFATGCVNTVLWILKNGELVPP